MKKLILGLLIILTYASCKDNAESNTDTEVEVETASTQSDSTEPTSTLEFDNAEAYEKVVKAYVDALQAGDVDGMNAHLAENAMIYNLGGGTDSLNVAQHKEYYTNSTNEYKHSMSRELYLPVSVTNNWNEGDWVLAWGVNTVTNKATGVDIAIPYHTANLLVEGKIVAMHYFYDMLNIMESQGFTITPPAE